MMIGTIFWIVGLPYFFRSSHLCNLDSASFEQKFEQCIDMLILERVLTRRTISRTAITFCIG